MNRKQHESSGIFYNDNDNNAVAWLKELIDMGELPMGKVDGRSITEIDSEDFKGFDQCHFFAGIGGWPLAFRIAGFSTGSVWSASLPCQPFSNAGKRKGHADERHLWPVFYRLVRECRPRVIIGEQIASKDGRNWFAAVRDDLVELGYAATAADLCAAGVGAPHIRQRLYWCAIRMGFSDSSRSSTEDTSVETTRYRDSFESADRSNSYWANPVYIPCLDGKCRPLPCRVADTGCRAERRRLFRSTESPESGARRTSNESERPVGLSGNNDRRADESGIVQGFDVLSPILVRGSGEGVPEDQIDPDATTEGRVMRLKGYGNAVVPELAAIFISSVMEILNESEDEQRMMK